MRTCPQPWRPGEADVSALDLGALVRSIIDANLYIVLATADEAGRPWASPVCFAVAGYREYLWVSSPEATHLLLPGQLTLEISMSDEVVPDVDRLKLEAIHSDPPGQLDG